MTFLKKYNLKIAFFEEGAALILACSKRSDSGERCEVKKAMKSRGELGREVRFPLSPLPLPRFYFFALLFTSHRSPLSERPEQATLIYGRHSKESLPSLPLSTRDFMHNQWWIQAPVFYR